MIKVQYDGAGLYIDDHIKSLLKMIFPHTEIQTGRDIKQPDLVVASHNSKCVPPVPYIIWSGEPYQKHKIGHNDPLFSLDTVKRQTPYPTIWYPQLMSEFMGVEVDRPIPLYVADKKYCAAYAYTSRVPIREKTFKAMRDQERSCYAFGPSCRTSDNPFVLARSTRSENKRLFVPFAFNFAMENSIQPGYITEKIGHAILAGSIPICWGDNETLEQYFNPEALINVSQFSSPEAVASYTVNVWRDPQKVQAILDKPMLIDRSINDYGIHDRYMPWNKPIVDILRDTFPDLS